MLRRLWLMGGMLVVLLLLACPYHGLAEERYTVKPGDSLYSISKSYGISVEALKEANGLEGSHLKTKQVLLIPNPKKKPTGQTVKMASPETEPYIVKQGDSLHALSKRTGFPVQEIKRMNQLQTDGLKTGQRLILLKKQDLHAADADRVPAPEDGR